MYQKISLTESAPGNTTKQNGSFLGPIKISWASGRVQVEPHWGGIRVSGSISSAVATGVQVLRDHSFKTSANFHDFWPLPPYHRHFSKMLMKGIFDPYVLWPFDYRPMGTPLPPKTCWRLKWMVHWFGWRNRWKQFLARITKFVAAVSLSINSPPCISSLALELLLQEETATLWQKM